MKTLTINTILLYVLINGTVSAQEYQINSSEIEFTIDSVSGGIQSIINKKDSYSMNWILTSDRKQYAWQTEKFAWGLGFCRVNGETIQWGKPATVIINKECHSAVYKTNYFDLTINRKIEKNGVFSESYNFENTGSKNISLKEIGIYTPFNDNYPDAKTCIESRCNAHIWAGGNASYVYAERMGGEAPHLGLVLTEGSLKSYEILNRGKEIGSSNARGTLVLNPADMTLQPKQTVSLKWVVFAANDWDDFYTKAKVAGFIKASAKKYVLEKKEALEVIFESSSIIKNAQCYLNDSKIDFTRKGSVIEVNTTPQIPGDQIVKMTYGNNQSTFVKAYCIENIDSLIKKRAAFIIHNQQLNDASDRRDGAYMVYDNETKQIYKNDNNRKSSDTNDGRERIGMGVFLAMYLQSHPDTAIQYSLERYVNFVRTKLQKPDYMVQSGVEGGKHRGYNYPWVAQLYLEMYKLTQENKYLIDSYQTLIQYYTYFKHGFYAIGIPVTDELEQLKSAGMLTEYKTLSHNFKQAADVFIKNGVNYPKSEVNYEQSIVAPAVVFLLEMYQVTQETKYLNEAEKQMPLLEAFNGCQPDYHLNDIAIRHWDGYWFGKKQFFGDVMPHYWSTTTAEAFRRYAAITGIKTYNQRAINIVRNNLCQFFNDGSASCAYIYPSKINGQKAGFYDPFVNDQDWALVYYLKYKQD